MVNLELLSRLGLSRSEIARRLQLGRSTVSMKCKGQRPWFQSEVDALLRVVRSIDRKLGYDDLFPPARPKARRKAA